MRGKVPKIKNLELGATPSLCAKPHLKLIRVFDVGSDNSRTVITRQTQG